MSNDTDLARTIVFVFAIVLLTPIILMAVAMPFVGMWGVGHMWDGTGMTGGWWISWLLFLVIIVGIGYLLYRALLRTEPESVDPALEELRIAYARGELSDEEFQTRRERLEDGD